jgi:hypothetical protein
MVNRAMLRLGDRKNTPVPTKNKILVQASKILPTISPIFGLTHPSIGTVLEIFQ